MKICVFDLEGAFEVPAMMAAGRLLSGSVGSVIFAHVHMLEGCE